MSQPVTPPAVAAPAKTGSSIFQTAAGIGCHCQNSRIRLRLASRTNVLRSIAGEAKRANSLLKPCLAMPLCCTAKIDIKARSISKAVGHDDVGPVLMVLG